MGQARVSTLAQKNGSAGFTVESAGTKTEKGIITDKPKFNWS
jgi:hypothetical protein